MLTALGVALLWLGAVTDVLDITFCFAASLVIVFAQIELGGKRAVLIYLATGILSLILLPSKFAAAAYLLIAGNYPMLKYILESKIKGKAVLFILKTAYFSLTMAVLLAISKFVLLLDEGQVIDVITFLLGVVSFILFDFVLTRLISVYYIKLRKRLRIERILK